MMSEVRAPLAKTRPLTLRQELVLGFIRRYIETKCRPPTLREIGKEMGIRSTNGVNDHLRALERKGYIVRDELVSRSIRVCGETPPVVPVVCYGCGRPL